MSSHNAETTSYFTSNPSSRRQALCASISLIQSGCSSPFWTMHSSRGFLVSGQQQQMGFPVLMPTFFLGFSCREEVVLRAVVRRIQFPVAVIIPLLNASKCLIHSYRRSLHWSWWSLSHLSQIVLCDDLVSCSSQINPNRLFPIVNNTESDRSAVFGFLFSSLWLPPHVWMDRLVLLECSTRYNKLHSRSR